MPTRPICFRVNEADRELIEAAASRSLKSISEFVKEFALAAARSKKMERLISDRQHKGVPTYMRASCYHASIGGAAGYKNVGYQLASKLSGESPFSLDDDEWQGELDKLSEILPSFHYGVRPERIESLDDQDKAVLRWFDEHYPRIMKIVPRRRRGQFVEGVYEAVADETIDLQV